MTDTAAAIPAGGVDEAADAEGAAPLDELVEGLGVLELGAGALACGGPGEPTGAVTYTTRGDGAPTAPTGPAPDEPAEEWVATAVGPAEA